MNINLDFIYPIGTIYETTSEIHPDISLGGTWELYGAGRVTICKDSSQTEFTSIGQTGGSKEMQQHIHQAVYGSNAASGNLEYYTYDNVGFVTNGFPTTGGLVYNTRPSGTGDSGNLQPYIVIYRYRRVA